MTHFYIKIFIFNGSNVYAKSGGDGEDDVTEEGVAKLLYAVYENGIFSRLLILDCPLDEEGAVVISLPEGAAPFEGDVIFLWYGLDNMIPLCENYTVE